MLYLLGRGRSKHCICWGEVSQHLYLLGRGKSTCCICWVKVTSFYSNQIICICDITVVDPEGRRVKGV